jgi:hypothetical protein
MHHPEPVTRPHTGHEQNQLLEPVSQPHTVGRRTDITGRGRGPPTDERNTDVRNHDGRNDGDQGNDDWNRWKVHGKMQLGHVSTVDVRATRRRHVGTTWLVGQAEFHPALLGEIGPNM